MTTAEVLTPYINAEALADAPEKISSLKGLRSFVEARGPLFINRLAAATLDSAGLGREIIGSNGRIISLKRGGTKDGALFTGKNLCTFASYALRDGLRNKVDGIDVDLVRLETNIFAENWGNPSYMPTPQHMRLHDIVRATDKNSGDTLYLDPTYAQIDHRKIGNIACLTEDDLAVFYSRPDTLSQVKSENFDFEHEIHKALRLTREGYNMISEALR